MQIKHTTSYASQIVKLLAATGVALLCIACLSATAFAQTVNSADSLATRLSLDALDNYDRSISLLGTEDEFDAEAGLADSGQGVDPAWDPSDDQGDQSQGDSNQEGADQGDDPDDPEEEKDFRPACAYATMPAPWIIWMKQISSSVEMTWTPVSGASGYYIYRCALKDGESAPASDCVEKWTLVATVSASKGTTWRGTGMLSGKRYAYRVQAYGAAKLYYFSKTPESQQPENCLARVAFRDEYVTSYKNAEGSDAPTKCYLRRVSVASETGVLTYLSAPSVTKFSKSTKSTTLKATWKKVPGADGYQIQYAKNRLFTSYKTKTLTGESATSVTIRSLKKKSSYYVRVRAFKKADGTKVYSSWGHSSTMQSVPTLTATIQKTQKKNSKSQIKRGAKKTQTMPFEIRSSAGQGLGGYDTVQGGTSDGTYGYYILCNRNVLKCKIAKVRLKTMKCVKVSAALPVAHGNGLTYNSKTKRLIVTHLEIDPLAISCVNPKTLKVEWKRSILIPDTVPGATASQLTTARKKGFGCITYDKKHDQYVGLLSGSHNFLIMDKSLTPLRYVTKSWKNGQVNQCVLTSGSYIMICESGHTTSWNRMAVYTWDGEYVGKWNLYNGAEMENAYFAKGKLYMSVYFGGGKTFTETKYVTKTVDGVKKNVKKNVTYVFPRSNCVYRITKF